jgi:integrase
MAALVKVGACNGWLRLRWSWERKTKTFYLGLPDTKVARAIATGKAAIIEADLISGNYDPTLVKYRGEQNTPKPIDKKTIAKALAEFTEYKRPKIDPDTLKKYAILGRVLGDEVGQMSVDLSDEEAEAIRETMGAEIADSTLKDRLSTLRACWRWGIKRGWALTNPWDDIRVKIAPKQPPRPFTKLEIQTILQGFRGHKTHSVYACYVEFLFATGCRTGEAIGLQWVHLEDDCSQVWIGESVSNGTRKTTKTNKEREFRLSDQTRAMLLARRPESPKPEDLVFPAPEGGTIDARNFRNRAWKDILKDSGVAYRRPYNTRHTFISHALKQRMDPMFIARMTGHNPKTLFANYAAVIDTSIQAPQIF